MSNNKTIGIVLLAADAIGIGGAAGFGYKQIVGAVAGVIVVVVGLVLYSRK